jgi:hypothetical protein
MHPVCFIIDRITALGFCNQSGAFDSLQRYLDLEHSIPSGFRNTALVKFSSGWSKK